MNRATPAATTRQNTSSAAKSFIDRRLVICCHKVSDVRLSLAFEGVPGERHASNALTCKSGDCVGDGRRNGRDWWFADASHLFSALNNADVHTCHPPRWQDWIHVIVSRDRHTVLVCSFFDKNLRQSERNSATYLRLDDGGINDIPRVDRLPYIVYHDLAVHD